MDCRSYFIYILTNRQKSVLYIGVTNNLERRLYEHRMKVIPGFSEKYQTVKLVYYEATEDVASAVAREKQLKRWSRKKKEWLIETLNPRWNDLSEEF
ncbi:MAG: GIY-YIG nuclease family protein [Patescibacteria group bacterium]